jgi:hypothetical protein
MKEEKKQQEGGGAVAVVVRGDGAEERSHVLESHVL